MYYLRIASTLSNVHESKLYGQRMTKENTAVHNAKPWKGGKEGYRRGAVSPRNAGGLVAAGHRRSGGRGRSCRVDSTRRGRTSAAWASRARARVILGNDGGPERRRRRRAAEIRWVGGGLAGRELEDAPGGAQCCFSCAGARVTTGGRRCGRGGQAARFRSPLRIGVGCTSLAARLKSGPNLERWFAARLFFLVRA
jgi:hypothetical protein